MKLLIFILKKTEKINELLKTLSQNGLKEATILKSSEIINSTENFSKNIDTENLIINSLKIILSKTENYSVTILLAVKKNEEKIFINVVEKVVGNLKNKNIGILFALPICYVCGLN